MGSPVFTAITLVLRLGIGVILFRLALNPKYRNLHWLAAVFYLNFFNVFLRGPAFGELALVVMVVIQVCLALFTHTTFYQHRRSPVLWVIGGLLAAGAVSLFLPRRAPTSAFPQPMSLMCALNWFWHGLVAWQVWHTLRRDRSVEDWIKVRYMLVVTYAATMGALFVVPAGRSVLARVPWLWPATFVVALLLQYLSWAMPAALRRYLNRNYRAPLADERALSMTEEEVEQALAR